MVILIHIFLMVNVVKHLAWASLPSVMSFKKCLFRSSANFLIGLLFFFKLSHMSKFIYFEYQPFSDKSLQISSPIQ